MNVIIAKFKEVLFSVLPVTLIVLILNFTLIPVGFYQIIRFLLGALFIIIGLTIFLFGVDIGVTPIGTLMGKSITKSNKIWIVGVAGLILGFFISIAEPDLHVLAEQVALVTSEVITKSSIVLVVSLGIAAALSLGLLRIIFSTPLNKFLTVTYLIILILGTLTTPEFMAIAFDASGATTGALTVPFILALAIGVSSNKKSISSEEDSFGLLGIASAGAIIGVMAMSVVSKTDNVSGNLGNTLLQTESIFEPFIRLTPRMAVESFIALLPLLLIFLVFQKVSFKLTGKAFANILKGLLYTFIGLVLFLTSVNAGFMDVGRLVGHGLASMGNKGIVIVVALFLGLVTILAEPAVHVLTHQIEDVTSGYVKRRTVLFALSLGVGTAVALAIIRIIVPGLQLWHYLLPGYIISIVLSYFVPPLFVGMAFDSGGVASGPMTATFILAFAQGVAEAVEGADVLIDGFGIIAMVALTPLIALQTLGLIFRIKSGKESD